MLKILHMSDFIAIFIIASVRLYPTDPCLRDPPLSRENLDLPCAIHVR